MPDYQVTTIFADDVRVEEGGKLFMVGVYGSDIAMTSSEPAPFNIDAVIWVSGPAATKVEKLVIEYLLDDEVIEHMTVQGDELALLLVQSAEEISALKKAAPSMRRGTRVMIFQGWTSFVVPQIEGTATLAARVDLGSGFAYSSITPIRWTRPSGRPDRIEAGAETIVQAGKLSGGSRARAKATPRSKRNKPAAKMDDRGDSVRN